MARMRPYELSPSEDDLKARRFCCSAVTTTTEDGGKMRSVWGAITAHFAHAAELHGASTLAERPRGQASG